MEWWGRQKGLRQTLRIEVAAGGKGRTIDRVTGELDAQPFRLTGTSNKLVRPATSCMHANPANILGLANGDTPSASRKAIHKRGEVDG